MHQQYQNPYLCQLDNPEMEKLNAGLEISAKDKEIEGLKETHRQFMGLQSLYDLLPNIENKYTERLEFHIRELVQRLTTSNADLLQKLEEARGEVAELQKFKTFIEDSGKKGLADEPQPLWVKIGGEISLSDAYSNYLSTHQAWGRDAAIRLGIALSRLQQLEGDKEELIKDKMRLDWLDSAGLSFINHAVFGRYRDTKPLLRNVIDAARSAAESDSSAGEAK